MESIFKIVGSLYYGFVLYNIQKKQSWKVNRMPFVEIKVKNEIEKQRQNDLKFRKALLIPSVM